MNKCVENLQSKASNEEDDVFWMREAIVEAKKAEAMLEVPIGAVIVHDGRIIGRGHNVRESTLNPTSHAEILAISEASQVLQMWRLLGCTLYVTLEPCPMCAGALLLARVPRVVFGAADPKAGCVGTLMNLLDDPRFNHQAMVTSGVLAEECGQLLSGFFRNLRQKF